MPFNLPTLSFPSAPKRPHFRFLRRASSPPDADVERADPQPESCPPPTTTESPSLVLPPSEPSRIQAGDLKIDIPRDNERDAPPAYGDINNAPIDEKNAQTLEPPFRAPAAAPLSPLSPAHGRAAMDGGDERAVASPIIQTATHDNQPTIMVLVKEDYEWARAYLKEFDYRKAARRATARHLYSEQTFVGAS